MSLYEKYVHWEGRPEVMVRKDLKGKHREHCLCFNCKLFHPEDRERNCVRANAFYAMCVLLDMTTPVWECPEFRPIVDEEMVEAESYQRAGLTKSVDEKDRYPGCFCAMCVERRSTKVGEEDKK